MKKLEKILAIGGLTVGISLVSYGLAKEKPVLTTLGFLSCSYPVGLLARQIIEEDNKMYFEEKNKNYPR
jgi:hypothetical protein